jgi:hypothetical protein
VSYLNSPRKGRPRGMITCVWTHLGLIKWKTISKKNKKWKTTSNKKMEDDLKQKNGRRPNKKNLKNLFSIPLKFRGKWKTTSKKKWKTTLKKRKTT